ncbi:chromosome segregation ATPase [Mucilaginibacter gracilis]|uniref:Chromosome segregation ATPase n=1 Tax=Mucilaginibacter gracilis TaxID=423350 RepID=A0A495J937_9SPHI|nr:hypothetical protein [Mucilaginibacter gracilis]RKR84902.1 chromosome segregation ATPase [Mucilaginibacter gracilis]
MDDTKKALLSIDIDTAALTQNADKAKEAVKALAEQLKELKTTGKESGEALDKIAEQIKKATEAADKSKDALKEFSTRLAEAAKSSEELKNNLSELTKKQTDSSKAQVADTNAAKEAEKAQKKLKAAISDTTKLLRESRKDYKNLDESEKAKHIKELIETYNNLNSTERENERIGGSLEKRITTLLTQQKGEQTEQDKLNERRKTGTKLIKAHKEILDTTEGSIVNTKVAILALTTEYLNLSEKQQKSARTGGVLKAKIDELQESLKKLESKSISDFSDRFVEAGKKILPFSEGIGKAAEQFKTLKEGFATGVEGLKNIGKSTAEYFHQVRALSHEQNDLNNNTKVSAKVFQYIKSGFEVATGGAKNFGKALVGTGIGAIIIAVGLLTDYLKNFKPIVDLIEQGMAGFNGAIAAGKHILDEFFGSIKSVGDLFSKLGNFIAHPIDSLMNLGKAMAEAGKKTFELKKAEQELNDDIQATAGKNIERETEIARLKSKLIGANIKDKEEYNKKIKALQKEETDENTKNTNKQIENTLSKVNAINGIHGKEEFSLKNLTAAKIEALKESKHLDDETVKSLYDALKQKNDIISKSFEEEGKIATEAQTKLAEQNKAADDKKAKAREAFKESQNRMILNNIKDANKREVAELEAGFKEQIKQFKKNSAAYLQLIKERDQKLKELAEKQAKDTQDKEAADDKALFDAQMQLKLAQAEGDFEKTQTLKSEQNKKDLEFDLKNSNLNEKQKQTLREQSALRDLEILKEGHEAKKAFLEKTLEEDKKLAEGETDPKKKLQAQIKVITDQYNLEVLLAKGNAAQLIEIEKKRTEATAALNKVETVQKKKSFQDEVSLIEAKTKQYSDHFTKLSGMFSKNTAAGKAAFVAQKAIAVAEIAINTEKQISAIYTSTREAVANDMDEGPIIGAIHAAIDIAIGAGEIAGTIANGIKQVSTINSTNPSGFAKGGLYLSDGQGSYLTGPGSGTSDSINAKLSNGESIINARSTQMFAPILSAINQAGGGRAFNTSTQGNGYALGGLFNGSNALNDGSTDLATTRSLNDMAKTMAASMPRQILVVEDVQASLQNKAMLHSMSNF